MQRFVHARCLAVWQQQLRAQKGRRAARRCDVCKAAWAKGHHLPSGPTEWRLLLRDLLRTVPWPALFEVGQQGGAPRRRVWLRSGRCRCGLHPQRLPCARCPREPAADQQRPCPPALPLQIWRLSLLGAGAVQGVRAGLAGLRAGAGYAADAQRVNLQTLAHWSPEAAVAAAALPPPLKAPLALALVAFVTGMAAQVALISAACAYASSLAGFALGVAASALGSLRLALVLTHGAATSAVGVARSVAAAAGLAAPAAVRLGRILVALKACVRLLLP